jgi:hypothetical protein
MLQTVSMTFLAYFSALIVYQILNKLYVDNSLIIQYVIVGVIVLPPSMLLSENSQKHFLKKTKEKLRSGLWLFLKLKSVHIGHFIF